MAGGDNSTSFLGLHASLVVLVLLLIPFFLDITASLLNRSWFSCPIPDALAGIYDEAGYATSQRYNKEKSTLALVQEFFETAVFLAFWFLGGFAMFDGLVMKAGMGQLPTGVLYDLSLGLCSVFLTLPFSVYNNFVLEARYGFNRMTPSTFIKDRLKAGGLILLLGTPLLFALLAFFMYCGRYAWLYTWLTLTSVQLVMFFLAPVLILPLFLEMTPLPDGCAIVIDGMDKEGPWVFLKRIYYEVDGAVHNGAKAYETRDRQYTGNARGAKLALWFDGSNWKISEGAPGDMGGTIYASTLDSAVSPEMASWRLHPLESTASESSTITSSNQPLAPEETSTVLQLVKHDVGLLRRDLLDLATRLDYTCNKIFIIDGSTRSEHSNAFCTGFGRFRRICLFDTLLAQLKPEEIVAVLGHEIGHDKLHHVKIGLLQTMVLSFVEFYLLGQFISSELLAGAFFLQEPKVYIGFLLFGIVWGTVETFISIPLTVQSRYHEHAADNFSVDAHKNYGMWLVSGLMKMTRNSKSNLTPHPLKVFLDYSHPPLLTRIRAIKNHQMKRWGTENDKQSLE